MNRYWLIPLSLILIAPVCSSLYALPSHKGPSYDAKPRNALDQLGEKIAKQHNLTLLLSGLASNIVDSKYDGLWALHFTSGRIVTLEEARPMAQQIAKQLIDFMMTNPLFQEYFNQSRPLDKSKTAPSVNDMGFKVAFWDKNVDRPLYPFLAEIRLSDGQMYYYYADPRTQALQEPIIERLY